MKDVDNTLNEHLFLPRAGPIQAFCINAQHKGLLSV